MADAIVQQDIPASWTAAKAAGTKHYFTGKPCKRGHTALRFTSTGQCSVCMRSLTVQYRKENPERTKENWKRHDEKHAEKRRAYHREYMKQNPEKNRANVKQWRLANPVAKRAGEQRRRSRKRASHGSHTAADIKRLHVLQRGCCAACFKPLRGVYHIDHRVALSRGGSNDWTNIQLLHPMCNMKKHAKDPIEYMQSEHGLLL